MHDTWHRRLTASAAVLALASLRISHLFATPWTVLWPRAMVMGGAYTAIAEGPVGAYWNPAVLGQPENPSGVQVPIGARAEFNGSVLQGANDLNQINKDCAAGGA